LNIGSFYAIDRQTLQQSIDGYYSPENVLSARQEVFLQKIARYCSGRNVKLILISTPVFQPEKYGNIELLTAYHQKYLPDVDWLNYSGFVLPDSCFWAVDHLNYRGAIIFSRYLQETFGQKAGHNLQHIKE
jgi:hypothetical protein